jgi:iron-sulfur cluster assembly accessory protein
MNILVTPDAVQVLRESKEQDTQLFRVGVLPGGCSGFKYNLMLEDNAEDDDVRVEVADDIVVIVDPFSAQYLDGVVLDYKSSMMGAGFTFDNPNAVGGCGCGSSFTA